MAPVSRRAMAMLAVMLCGMVCGLPGCASAPARVNARPGAAQARRLLARLQMVAIPGGTFRMGDPSGHGLPNERPVHAVTIRPFKLGRYPVTVAEFRYFILATGYQTEAERNVVALWPWAIDGCGLIDAKTGKLAYRQGLRWNAPGFAQQDSDPVVCVSWNDAQEFIQWLDRTTGRRFRLPSEAEWEYAARAGATTTYFWGNDPAQSCRYGNGADETAPPDGSERPWPVKIPCHDGYFYTSPVGHYSPNAFGLYDMVGNVRQWTQDCAHDSYISAPADGSPWIEGNCARRMARGNSLEGTLKVAARGHGTRAARDYDFGFRVAEDY